MTEDRSEGEAAASRGELLVARAREEGVALTGQGGLLTGLMRQVLQTGLEVEIAEHLGVSRCPCSKRISPGENERVSACSAICSV
jgi:hypothetical protein